MRPRIARLFSWVSCTTTWSSTARYSNSFDMLRLVAAMLVLYSHNFVLRGMPEPTVGEPTLGRIGVIMFFAISGYLNAASILNSQNAASFLLNRALRIYPAVIVCVATVVCVASIFSAVGFSAYWASGGPWRYAYLNCLMLVGELEWFLPGVFDGNPFRGGVNGSLWSLPYELVLYIVLAVSMGVARYKKSIIFALLAAILATGSILELPPTIHVIVPLQTDTALLVGYVFFLGAAIAALRHHGLTIASGFAVLISLGVLPIQALWGCIGLFSTAVILIGHLSLPLLRPERDISYGLYLYAFPIQQTSVLLVSDFWLGLLLSGVIAAAAGTLSSLFIEEPFLRLKRGYKSMHANYHFGQ